MPQTPQTPQTTQAPIQSIDEILLRKEELMKGIQEKNEKISVLWHELVTPNNTNSKGELIVGLVNNSITAIDGFLLVHKLIKGYSFLFHRKKKK